MQKDKLVSNLLNYFISGHFCLAWVMLSHVPDLPGLDSWMLFTEEWLHPLFVERLPVNIDEGLAVHAVDVEDSIQVIHLVLEDSSWPATGLPRNIFTLLIQPCKGNIPSKNK